MLILGLILLVIYLVLRSITFPLSHLEGCYQQVSSTPFEKICFYANGSFSQLSPESDGVYRVTNTGFWKMYSVEYNGDRITGVTLSEYNNYYGGGNEIDIFPYQTILGNSVFFINGIDNESKDRIYNKK